jgi:cytochrome c oxidase subunit IV
MASVRANRWGARAKPPVFTHASGGFAVNALMHVAARELTMTVLLPPVFFVIFIALVLAVLLAAANSSKARSSPP